MTAGSPALPVDIEIASGRAASVYTTAALAPAVAAFSSFVSKVHTPRKISATDPASDFSGRLLQAIPSPSKAATSDSGPVIGEGAVESPAKAGTGWRPSICTWEAKIRSLNVLPTEIADGEVPGEAIVFGF